MLRENGKDPKQNKKIRNDIIFIICLVLVVLIAGLCLFFFKTEGNIATVTVDGELWGKYSLNEDTTVEIKTERGVNILVIKDGYAYVIEASCPDGICSSHKPVKYEGQSIICLPNKVVITVNTEHSDMPDITV